MRTVARQLRAFGHFWLDFLVGDTLEVFVGALVIVGVAVGLRHDRPAGIALTILLTVAVLVASVWRGRRRTA